MRKIAIIAPHYSKSEFNGANYYCDWVIMCLSDSYQVDLFSRDGVYSFWKNEVTNFVECEIRSVSRVEAAVKSLAGGNYFEKRMMSTDYVKLIKNLNFKNYCHVVVSFLHVYFGLSKKGINFPISTSVLTHNFDVDIFDRWIKDRGLNSVIGRISKKIYLSDFKKIKNNVNILSISESDSVKFEKIAPVGSRMAVCPVASAQPKCVKIAKSDKIKIAFLGSLNTPFNVEALFFFKKNIFFALKNSINFEFHVIGSSPGQNVIDLAAENDWVVHKNLSDEEVDRLLVDMDVGILPFEYTQGIKLKLWKFFSIGVPVIGTKIFYSDVFAGASFFKASDNFDEWGEWIKNINHVDNKSAYIFWESEFNRAKTEVIRSLAIA